MALIGHEIWHAWEVLGDASLKSEVAINNFYSRIGHQLLGATRQFETKAAVTVGAEVLTELRRHMRMTGHCG
jgi:hypothetical protein